jgi:hypothetical protein
MVCLASVQLVMVLVNGKEARGWNEIKGLTVMECLKNGKYPKRKERKME